MKVGPWFERYSYRVVYSPCFITYGQLNFQDTCAAYIIIKHCWFNSPCRHRIHVACTIIIIGPIRLEGSFKSVVVRQFYLLAGELHLVALPSALWSLLIIVQKCLIKCGMKSSIKKYSVRSFGSLKSGPIRGYHHKKRISHTQCQKQGEGLQNRSTGYLWALRLVQTFSCPLILNKTIISIHGLLSGFQGYHQHCSPLSKAICGKFHSSGGYSKPCSLKDPANSHRSRAGKLSQTLHT